jgi:glycosyltransferase involved in cell wall biosynthesis
MTEPIDIVLPAHNEGDSIGATLTEFHEVLCVGAGIPIRFVICEDGSTDNTVAVIQELAKKLPIHLISDPERKGYSRAVIDGLRATTSSLIGFIDSDGQCHPGDFTKLLAAQRAGGIDLAMGYRNPRDDHWIRLLMSGAFGFVYGFYFKVPVRDPSCPYLLISRSALEKVMVGRLGILKQGFWWEFLARCTAAKLRIGEVPVVHRNRLNGQTQVYKPTKVPRIAWEHLRGLALLKRELRRAGEDSGGRFA